MSRYEFYVDMFKWAESQVKEMHECGYRPEEINIAYTHIRATIDRFMLNDPNLSPKEQECIVVCSSVLLRNIRPYIFK